MIPQLKKFSLKAGLLILLSAPCRLMAQYTQIIAGPNITPGINYIYVGSLTLDPGSASNCQKIKVSVLGGTWLANNIGETVYYIANRGGLAVNQIVTGGSGLGNTTLRAFQNGGNTDFYLQISYSASYYAMAVSSYVMGGLNATGQNITITASANTPPGTDITSTVAYIPVLFTDQGGNIGIGTISPNGFKFAVKGNIHAEQVNVDLNNWADYVFKKDYQLPTLTEVKTYIDQNHHLPEIPTAEQIEKDGLNLGEINKLLVKKVEELTLYLIEKDKEIGDEKNNRRQTEKKLTDQLALQTELLKAQQVQLQNLERQFQLLVNKTDKK